MTKLRLQDLVWRSHAHAIPSTSRRQCKCQRPVRRVLIMHLAGNGCLEHFQRQYLQNLEPDKLSWPSKEQLRDIGTQTWLYDRLFNERSITYLPPKRYQLRVLKKLLRLIEESLQDPNEDVGLALILPNIAAFNCIPSYPT